MGTIPGNITTPDGTNNFQISLITRASSLESVLSSTSICRTSVLASTPRRWLSINFAFIQSERLVLWTSDIKPRDVTHNRMLWGLNERCFWFGREKHCRRTQLLCLALVITSHTAKVAKFSSTLRRHIRAKTAFAHLKFLSLSFLKRLELSSRKPNLINYCNSKSLKAIGSRKGLDIHPLAQEYFPSRVMLQIALDHFSPLRKYIWLVKGKNFARQRIRLKSKAINCW